MLLRDCSAAELGRRLRFPYGSGGGFWTLIRLVAPLTCAILEEPGIDICPFAHTFALADSGLRATIPDDNAVCHVNLQFVPGPMAKRAFNAQEFLDSAGIARKVVEFKKKDAIFSQGDPAENVLYLQKGGVRLFCSE